MKGLWLVPPKGEPVGVTKTPMMVGREAGADIVVDHPSVSRRHALLERSGQDWQVADQKSANGTWIDGQRVIRAVLRAGQSLRFGAVPFQVAFERPRPPAAPPARPPRAAAVHVAAALPAPAPAPGRTAAGGSAAQAGGSTLSPAQAAELLGLTPGAPAAEVRRQYQKIYNDYQIRLTNAPTASLKRMYQKSIQELKAAAEVLSPGLLARERD
jgi:predicted component of type VI protein secretion system